MAYLRFFCAYPRTLSFGILLTLFSSFGQTFLISLFVPGLLVAFALNPAQFGSLYAAATLLSAVSLPFFGRLIDRTHLRSFSLGAGCALALACMLMACAPNVPILFIALLGLRLSGQGLLSLTASTTMARAFEHGRGRALSVAAIGYPLGEALLPLLIVIMLPAAGWRVSWGIQGIIVACVLLPALSMLTERHKAPHAAAARAAGASLSVPSVFRDLRFYALLPCSLFLPLALTALFLYQGLLAEERGFTLKTMGAAFVGFAAARFAASLVIGPLIDRWCAKRLFPVVLLPAACGLLFLWNGPAAWAPFAFFVLAGVSQGCSGPTMTALWSEIYGVASLGAIKGTTASLSIISTALGPVMVGWLLQAGLSFSVIVPAFTALALLVAGTGLVVQRSFLTAEAHDLAV